MEINIPYWKESGFFRRKGLDLEALRKVCVFKEFDPYPMAYSMFIIVGTNDKGLIVAGYANLVRVLEYKEEFISARSVITDALMQGAIVKFDDTVVYPIHTVANELPL